MHRLLLLYICVLASAAAWAQPVGERLLALTDKTCYMAGERLCVRVDVWSTEPNAPLSRVAYVELSDATQMYAQGMVALTDGQGWAEIALPQRMHSGSYRLTAYTRAMSSYGSDSYFSTTVGVINGEQLSRRDQVRFLPLERYSDIEEQSLTLLDAYRWAPGAEVAVHLPESDDRGCSVTLQRASLFSHLPQGQVSAEPGTPVRSQTPEIEGHIVRAVPMAGATPSEDVYSRLAMIGKTSTLYDGQPQSDGSFLYYTSGISGNLPTLVSAYDNLGRPQPYTLSSPYERVLPGAMPLLQVYCQEEELVNYATYARRQAVVNEWFQADTLSHSVGFMHESPRFIYDLDEYTHMSSVREILVEFVRGVKRKKHHGINMLYTFLPEQRRYSDWPALVLLDGMPVYDVDKILEYDAHLVKYVQIYTGRFSFGHTCCQGVISFVTRGGRLSNYQLDDGSHLMSYAFPQERPAFVDYVRDGYGTLLWLPVVHGRQLTLQAPTVPGRYRLTVQGLDRQGHPYRVSSDIEVR